MKLEHNGLLAFLMSYALAASADQPVVLFSQTYCPSCLAAKQFFEEEGIAYREYDIETSPIALEYFEKLGGRGTPLLFVNRKRLEGFSEERFRVLYGRNPPGDDEGD